MRVLAFTKPPLNGKINRFRFPAAGKVNYRIYAIKKCVDKNEQGSIAAALFNLVML